MAAGYFVVVSAPSIGRLDRINERPTSLLNARRVLWSFAARLERMPTVYGITPDYWVAETGELCEDLRWHYAECDGVEGCDFSAFICDDVAGPTDSDDLPWTRD